MQLLINRYVAHYIFICAYVLVTLRLILRSIFFLFGLYFWAKLLPFLPSPVVILMQCDNFDGGKKTGKVVGASIFRLQLVEIST